CAWTAHCRRRRNGVRAWLDNPGLRRGRLCRPVSKVLDWRTFLPSSTSRSCAQSTDRVVTAATDTAGPPLDHPAPWAKLLNVTDTAGRPNDTVAPRMRGRALK